MIKFIRKNYVYICMLFCFLCLTWRSFMGFCWTDESFYVSTCDRFYRGQIPLVDEWFRTQMSSVVMLPFYALFVAVTGSNAGVILYFRILYLLLCTAVAILYYRVLEKEYPRYVGLGAAIFIMCYAHLNNATFSYYMLSTVLLMAALILIYDCRDSARRGVLILAGVLTALSVLCMPAFVIGYVPVMLGAVILLIVKKSKTLRTVIIYTVIGVAIPAVLFAIWLFLHVDIGYLTDVLPKVLVDNEHNESLGYFIRKPHRCLMDVFGMYTYASYILIALSFVSGRFLKKHPFCDIIVFADTVLFAIMAVISFGHTGYVHVAFFLFALPVFFVSEKKNHTLFWMMVIPAGLVSVIYSFTSSDFLYVIALGLSVAVSACLCAVCDYIRAGMGQGIWYQKLATASAAAACVVCLVITVALRFTNVYRDAPIGQLTRIIPTGVAKGLYTTDEHLSQYVDIYEMLDEYCLNTDDIEPVSGNPNGNVMFSKILPWGYAVSRLDCGFPSTWRTTAFTDEQLDLYYETHKTSVPDVIIVLDSRYGSYDASGDVDDDHEPNLDEMGQYWKDYIRDNGFEETVVKCGKVYFRPKNTDSKGEQDDTDK
ncbi:MAG: hypothetical protein J5367_02120 [Lachnospiraceae bacterium]|nr:hypothetical protein [Lachnospiraceae bacterium]